MKKLISILLCAVLLLPVASCQSQNNYTVALDDVTFEYKLGSPAAKKSHYVTPTELDLDKLASGGYSVEITVSYEVSYEKSWGLGDTGYVGAPKYDVTLLDKNGIGEEMRGTVPENNPETKEITYTANAVDIKDNSIVLTFSTANIQNVVCFKNIVVSYRAVK